MRRALSRMVVERRGVSVALACRAFDISESCYRYEPILSDENALIADWLESLTTARKNWGFRAIHEVTNRPVDDLSDETGSAQGACVISIYGMCVATNGTISAYIASIASFS